MKSRTESDRDQWRRIHKETDENAEKKQRHYIIRKQTDIKRPTQKEQCGTEGCSQNSILIFRLTNTNKNIKMHLLILRTERIYLAQSCNKFKKCFYHISEIW